MEFKIIWSEFAEKQLDNIYDFYQNKAGVEVAKKLLRGIISEPDKLQKNTRNRTGRTATCG